MPRHYHFIGRGIMAIPAAVGGIPTVGPFATWNGTALSGSIAVAPSDTSGPYTRTAAGKPTARWLQPGGQRLWQDLYIGVAAYAQGGITSVVFKGDCATTTVTTPTLRTYTGSDGITKSAYGYWIKLSQALFTAVSTSGAAQIFAEITATNGSMAKRIIGCQMADPINNYLSDWTHVFYPRTSESDFNKTIGPSGADYVSIDAFLNAARAANAESPKGTFITTGSYTATNGTAGTTGTGNAKSFAVLTAQAGVTATINRSAGAYSTTVHSANYTTFASNPNAWRPGWPGIEFRGAGVVLDRRYWNMYSCNAPSWFNGCKLTNSASGGTGQNSWQYFYNGSQPDYLATRDDGGNTLSNFMIDCTLEYGNCDASFQYCAYGVKQRFLSSSPFQKTVAVLDTYSANLDSPSWYDTAFPVMKLYYTGAGAPTYDMTYSYDPTNLVLKVNGAAVYTIALSDITGAGPLYIADLAAYINANCTNWVATATTGTNGDYIRATFLQSATGAAVGTSAGTATQLYNSINNHTEWAVLQGIPFNSQPQENVLHAYNTTAPSCAWNTGIHPFFWVQDAFIFNNAFICSGGTPGSSYPNGGDTQYSNSASISNAVLANNDWDGGLQPSAGVLPSNVVAFLNTVEYWHDNNTTDPSYPSFVNNLMALGQNHMPNGPNSSGNVQLGSGGNSVQYDAIYTNKAAGNYKPAGAKLANLFAQTFPYDRNYNPRNMSSDAAGSSAIGFNEPSRPF